VQETGERRGVRKLLFVRRQGSTGVTCLPFSKLPQEVLMGRRAVSSI